jgi:acetyltransferase-like isoleucine patch superfamily enzyme
MPNVRQILASYNIKQLIVRVAEEYLWWVVMSFPGYEGVYLRYLFLKCTTRKLDGFCWIGKGCRIVNSYGLSIGKAFMVNTNVQIDALGGIEIGDNTGIGPNSVLIAQEHNMLSKHGFTGKESHKNHRIKPIKLGSDVWIGANCFIKAGITIGDRVVVGACSNVISDVADHSTVIGSPARPYARVMREFFSDRQ